MALLVQCDQFRDKLIGIRFALNNPLEAFALGKKSRRLIAAVSPGEKEPTVPHIPFARSAFIAIGIILGTRVELANSGARLIMQPDWETITWTENERKKGQAWGLKQSKHSILMEPHQSAKKVSYFTQGHA